MRGAGATLPGGIQTTAAYRLGPGAARVLAGRLLAGAIPGVGLALAVSWAASNCFEKQGSAWVRTCGPGVEPAPQSDGFLYFLPGGAWSSIRGSSPSEVCKAVYPTWSGSRFTYTSSGGVWIPAANSGTCNGTRFDNVQNETIDYPFSIERVEDATCPAGWYRTGGGCVQTQPPATVTQQEIEDELATKPLPQTLPPGVPYPLNPVGDPVIFNPTITFPPQAQPLRVPQGNPQPIPNTDPQEWGQPVTRYTPAPSTDNPWRLDVTPETVRSPSPNGITDPVPVTPESPAGEPKDPDLCEKNPDILACAKWKLGELDATPVPNKVVDLAINKEDGFGPANGQCPAPKTATVLGMTLSFPWTLICDVASMIRPLLIGFAWLSAALTFIGIGRKD